MDGENNGKPYYFKMDGFFWGKTHHFWKHPGWWFAKMFCWNLSPLKLGEKMNPFWTKSRFFQSSWLNQHLVSFFFGGGGKSYNV